MSSEGRDGWERRRPRLGHFFLLSFPSLHRPGDTAGSLGSGEANRAPGEESPGAGNCFGEKKDLNITLCPEVRGWFLKSLCGVGRE